MEWLCAGPCYDARAACPSIPWCPSISGLLCVTCAAALCLHTLQLPPNPHSTLSVNPDPNVDADPDPTLYLIADSYAGMQVRTWQGNVIDLPAFQGPFDAVFFNAVFGHIPDQKAALTAAALRLKPGGHVVVSHPRGRPWLQVHVCWVSVPSTCTVGHV